VTRPSNEITTGPVDGAFIAAAEPVLSRLRTAVRRLVDAAPTPVRRAADLQRALSVEGPLGWQIFRLAMVTDPFASVFYIPRAGSMAKVLRQAREQGFDAGAAAAVAVAFQEFERLVARQAGGRGNFDAMIAAMGRGASEQIDTKQRGAAFRANTHVWGLRVRTDYRGAIWHPGSRPGWEHGAMITGRIDLQHLRPTAVLGLLRGAVTEEGGAPPGPSARTHVLEEFCSSPCPRVEVIQGVDGFREVIRPSGVGAAAAVTFFGYLMALDWNQGRPQASWGARTLSTVPSEVMLTDLLIPRGWASPEAARVSTHGNLSDVQGVFADEESFTMPARETVQYLGHDLEMLHTPDVPRCPELVRSVIGQLGWLGTEYDIFRCRVRYPILHSMVALMVGAPA
jgi:hypothetical protein